MSRSISETAVAMLARREHSVFEVKRKLRQKNFEDAEIDSIIEQLQANNLLSEERFTESYINMRKRRGYGPLRIAQELKERGIETDLYEPFLDRTNQEWHNIMQQQYLKKYGDQPAAEYAEKARRAKHLQSRGFPLDWVFRLNELDIS
ncbi:MAG: recombination regulator RecX [Gammaproteobacteria bacterium]|nr:recombination regulator RecX [Gammaproteobacteria bacterium]